MTESWNERSEKVIAQNYLTASKRPDQHMNSCTHITGSKKNHLIGTDGNKYFDFVSGLGANILDIQNVFTLPHRDEVVLAEMIVERFPVDKVKFFKTGSAACEGAIRIARGYTKKSVILSSGYHGSNEAFVSVTPPAVGCVNDGRLIDFPSIEDIIRHIKLVESTKQEHDIAAVIVEPIQLEDSDYSRKILKRLRNITRKNNILLVFDEMITNCRVPKYCIGNYYNIRPDMMCMGKAIGNGYPISVLGGVKKVMDTPDYFLSNTHNGELSSIQSAIETLNQITPTEINKLWNKGQYVMNNFLAGRVYLKGYNTRAVWMGNETDIAKLWQEMARRGYHLGKAFFIRIGMSWGDLERFCKTANKVIKDLDDIQLELEIPQPIFKR